MPNPVTNTLWKTMSRSHIFLYRLLKGRIPILDTHTILITTIGRKSGTPRTTPLLSARDGENYILIASKGGSPNDPIWYRNLKANPNVSVEDHGRVVPTLASEIVDDEERPRLWAKMMAIYPFYDSYQQRTGRKIPVVLLTPVR